MAEIFFDIDSVIGDSASMQAVKHQVKKLAPKKVDILLTGETGVGKDVIAQAIHTSSLREGKPFRAVNCNEFAESLLEDALFGHEKGAFTGAISQRKGIFEQADEGTLFLDEIGDMLPETQIKFLRVLETREITRLGGGEPIKVDVRIIAATNVNLVAAVMENKFREDLFYRVFLPCINIPPLRDRCADIPCFVDTFSNIKYKFHSSLYWFVVASESPSRIGIAKKVISGASQ